MSVQRSHAMANRHDDGGVMNGLEEEKTDRKMTQPAFTSQRRRSIGQSKSQNDPMTLSIKLIVYPILFLALLLVHLVYYLTIKARASWRYQRSIIQFMRSDERLKTIKGKKAYKKETARIKEQHELAAQVRLARMECLGRTNVPRHIALSIGPKPIRTSILLLRAMKISTKSLRMRMTSWRPNKAKELYREKAKLVAEAREQEKYAWDNLEAALRNCALSGIRELTVYDIEGYLANRFSETQKEIIEQEWTLPHETIEDEELIEGDTVMLPNGNSAEKKMDRKHIQITATIYRPFRAPTLHDIYRRPSLTPHKDGNHSVQVRINILGPEDGRQALAKAASILSKRQRKSSGPCKVGEKEVRDVLSEHGYPSDPELLIIHGGPRQVSTLHAFPPWLVRLCEIYHDADASPYQPLSSTSFEKALQAFAKSEQRLGK